MMYLPSPQFMRKLHELDKLLDAKWDPIIERWKIYREGKYIMTLQDTDGSYLPLDNRAIQRLIVADSHRYGSQRQFINSLRLEDDDLMRKKRKEQDEFISACHRDMAPFLRGRKSFTASEKVE